MAHSFLARPLSLIGAATCAALALSALPSAASATVVTLADTYYGGLNTYNGQDVIGTSVFDVLSASVQRIGAGGNTLQVTINTNYAGAPGTPAAEGTGYGALFLTPGFDSWHPTGVAPYPTDVYQPGEWTYAFTIPQSPGSNSGAGGLYLTSAGTVQLANVNGNTITAPFAGNPGYFFRQGQAVQFTPGANAAPVAIGQWSIAPGQIIFDVNDNRLLGDNFSLSWAMTCGNDVIQGAISGVPEPSTWAMMLVGLGGLGALMRGSRRRRPAASAA